MQWERVTARASHEVQGLGLRTVVQCRGLRQNRNRELQRQLGEGSLAEHHRLPEDVEWPRSGRFFPHDRPNDVESVGETGLAGIRLRVAIPHALGNHLYRQEWRLLSQIPLWNAGRILPPDRWAVHQLVSRRYQAFWQSFLLSCSEIVWGLERGVPRHFPSRQRRTVVQGLLSRQTACDSQLVERQGGTVSVRLFRFFLE